MELKRPKKKDSPPPAPKPVFKPMVPQPPRSAANDDEIDRIKRENKTKEAAQATTTEATATTAAVAAPPVVTTAAATPTSTLSPVAVTASTVTPSASTAYSRTTVTASSAAVSAVTARQIPAAVDPPLVAHQDSQPVRPKRTVSNLVPESTTAAAAAQPAYASRYTSRSGSPSSIVNRYAGGASSIQAPSRSAYASPQPPVVDDSPESDYSTSSDSDTSSDSEDDDPEEEAADDGYEYEYYTEEDASKKPSKVAEASVKPKSPPASSYVPSYASASQAAPSAVGSYYSSMGASSYGAASSYTEPPTRNQSAPQQLRRILVEHSGFILVQKRALISPRQRTIGNRVHRPQTCEAAGTVPLSPLHPPTWSGATAVKTAAQAIAVNSRSGMTATVLSANIWPSRGPLPSAWDQAAVRPIPAAPAVWAAAAAAQPWIPCPPRERYRESCSTPVAGHAMQRSKSARHD